MKLGLKFILLLSLLLPVPGSKACLCNMPRPSLDSLPQLRPYQFIALVKIVDDTDTNENKFDYSSPLKIKIIELFKGDSIREIYEPSRHSSCDLGIYGGQEWILFGKMSNGQISVFACDWNVCYKKQDGLRDWENEQGFNKLKQLRKFYGHPEKKYFTGERKEYYGNGKLEISESYENGKLNGDRKTWYPNGQTYGEQHYKNGSINGNSRWYYSTGQLSKEEYFVMGKQINIRRVYFDSSIDQGREQVKIGSRYRMQPWLESIYDTDGNEIIEREFTRLGVLKREYLYEPKSKMTTFVFYHNNGVISSIDKSIDGKNHGHYQEYDENGIPTRGWDYDENGKLKCEVK